MNFEITHTETLLHFMNNHYPRFSDISLLMNYHEWIIHHDSCRVANSVWVLIERLFGICKAV